MSELLILHTTVVVVVAIAAWTDWRTGLIPNWLTLPCIAGALIAHLVLGGPWGILLSGIGLLVSAATPLFLFWRDAMGGGDVKLFAAIGALLGPHLGLKAQLVSFTIAAILALVVMAWRGTMFRTFANAFLNLVAPLLPEDRQPEVSSELTSTMRIGFSVFVGTTLVLVGSHLETWQ